MNFEIEAHVSTWNFPILLYKNKDCSIFVHLCPNNKNWLRNCADWTGEYGFACTRKTPQSKVIITASSPWARLIGSEALICDHDGLRLTLGDDMYSDGNVSLILVAS